MMPLYLKPRDKWIKASRNRVPVLMEFVIIFVIIAAIGVLRATAARERREDVPRAV